MKIFVIILALLVALPCAGQHAFHESLRRASRYFYERKQYDSALLCYLQINRDHPAIRRPHILNKIADCYLALADTMAAEKNYLECLLADRKLDSFGSSQTNACFSLSDIYYQRKEFGKALIYLNYTANEYRPLRRMCQGLHGGYEQRLQFAYKRSLCHYGLGKKDSALAELAPWIFRPRSDVWLDSTEFETMTQYFVNTVFEVYGRTKARDQLQQALRMATYQPNYDRYRGANMIMFSLDYFISFANTRVDLFHGGGYQVDKKGEIPPFFSKEVLLKEFTDSPAYRYIMDCENDLLTVKAGRRDHRLK